MSSAPIGEWLPWYPQVKGIHIALVAASGALFVARGVGVMCAARWPMQPGARWGSVAIDTGLLCAGALLWAMLGLDPLRNAWLGTKLVLLLGYIGAGSVALKRGRTAPMRALAFAVALGLFGFIVGVALNHRSLGWFAGAGNA